MNFRKFFKNTNDWDKRFPVISSNRIEDLEVKMPVPNMSSISSYSDEYEILPGIRKVEMFPDSLPTQMFYSRDDIEKSKDLAQEIKNSKWISPLIVGVEDGEDWILEGMHRLAALAILGYKSFPAIVVLYQD